MRKLSGVPQAEVEARLVVRAEAHASLSPAIFAEGQTHLGRVMRHSDPLPSVSLLPYVWQLCLAWPAGVDPSNGNVI